MDRKPPALAPETVNSEQDDEWQGQSPTPRDTSPEEVADSDRGGSNDPAELIPPDTPDLVERMEDMVHSGRIDNDAYRGEPVHDDEPGTLGDTGEDDDEV